MRSVGYRQWEAGQYAVLTNQLIASDKRTTDTVTYAEFVDIFMTEPERGEDLPPCMLLKEHRGCLPLI